MAENSNDCLKDKVEQKNIIINLNKIGESFRINVNITNLFSNTIDLAIERTNPESNKMSSAASNRKTFETSSSTIQAGDPSILIQQHSSKHSNKYEDLATSSKLLTNLKAYRHQSILDSMPSKLSNQSDASLSTSAIGADIKFLNEFAIEKKKLQQQHGVRLNTVDVIVPSGKKLSYFN